MAGNVPLYDFAEMERRLRQIDLERAQLVALMDAARAYEAALGSGLLTGTDGKVSSNRQPASRGASIMQATEELAAQLMEQKGGPISTGELIHAVRAAGMPLPERNASNVISARMSNSRRFRGRRGVGWWYVDRPWPDSEPPSFAALISAMTASGAAGLLDEEHDALVREARSAAAAAASQTVVNASVDPTALLGPPRSEKKSGTDQ